MATEASAQGGPDTSIIVCNFGTHTTRIGFAGDAAPSYLEPSRVWARPMPRKDKGADSATRKQRRPVDGRTVYFSAESAPYGCVVTSPVANGLIHDWDAAFAHIERALARADAASGTTAEPTRASHSAGSGGPGAESSGLRGRNLLVVDGALAPRGAREQWAIEAIEHRGATGVCFIREPASICFAHGLSSALVVDIGASKTSVTPVENGFQVMMGHRRSGVAGDFLDTIAAANVPGCAPARAATASSASGADGSGPEWLDPLAPHTAAQRQAAERMALDAARRVREQLGSCGAPPLTEQGTFDTERPVAAPKAGLTEGGGTVPGSVRLGMGQELLVASEAAAAGALAVPKRPPGSSPLADLVVSSLVGLDDAVRTACGEAVLLTGGAACTAHCADRLSFELERLGAAAAVGVSFYLLPVPLDETFTSPWMGGSIVASAGTLPDLFLTAAEWKASGKDELHTRCP